MFQRLLVLVLLAGIAVPAFAQTNGFRVQGSGDRLAFFNTEVATDVAMFGPAGGQVPDEVVQRVKAALNLSDTQVNAIKSLLTIRSQMMTEAMREMTEKQMALQSILTQSNPNATDLGNAFLAVRAIESRLQAAEEKFRTDALVVLSAEQRARLESLETAASQVEALRMVGLLDGFRAGIAMPFGGVGVGGGAVFGAVPGAVIRTERRFQPVP